MTPLETSENRKVGNKTYDIKHKIYSQSKFHITKAIAEDYDCWNELKIEARQNKLAKYALTIWKIPFKIQSLQA
jgi:hypothetical protein